MICTIRPVFWPLVVAETIWNLRLECLSVYDALIVPSTARAVTALASPLSPEYRGEGRVVASVISAPRSRR